jgi:hypothetical protein
MREERLSPVTQTLLSAALLGSESAERRRPLEKEEVRYAILFSEDSLHKHFVWYSSKSFENVANCTS